MMFKSSRFVANTCIHRRCLSTLPNNPHIVRQLRLRPHLSTLAPFPHSSFSSSQLSFYLVHLPRPTNNKLSSPNSPTNLHSHLHPRNRHLNNPPPNSLHLHRKSNLPLPPPLHPLPARLFRPNSSILSSRLRLLSGLKPRLRRSILRRSTIASAAKRKCR